MDPIREVLLSVSTAGDSWRTEVLEDKSGANRAIHAVDREELADWFSGNVHETALRVEATNLFFHPLPSGAYTIGRIVPRESGYAAILGNHRSFFVQHFIVSANTLQRFSNNPITLFQQLYAHGHVKVLRRAAPRSEPIILPEPQGLPSHVDERLLEQLSLNPGSTHLAVLLQKALDSVCTFFTGGPSSIRLISGLLNLLPISWRPELTFSSELYFSRSRPFKLIGTSRGSDLFHLNSGDAGISFCDLSHLERENATAANLAAWPRLVSLVLMQGQFSLFERIIHSEHEKTAVEITSGIDSLPGTNPEELTLLAEKWFAELFPGPDSTHTSVPAFRILSPKNQPITPYVLKTLIEIDEFQPENSAETTEIAEIAETTEESETEIEEETVAAELFEDDFSRLTKKSDTNLPVSIAILLEKKAVQLKDSGSTSQRLRQQRFPNLCEELKWLDSCLARVLLGDRTAQIPFQICWRGICSLISPSQRLELVEEYCQLVRDFMAQHAAEEEIRPLERDLNILEVLDLLLSF